MRWRRGVLAVVLAAAACGANGPPANFVGGSGERWTLPLVGALEDNLLITPVLLDSSGPYLFAIDPDANVSIVDEQLVKEGRLAAVKGPARLDESASEQPRFYAEVRALELGSLIVERVTAMIVRTGALDQNGRRIHGVLGRDALADSLVFSFDRDQGLAYLTTRTAFKPPPDAIEIPFTPLRSPLPGGNARPLDRRVVTAMVNGHALAMHLDLGAATSQLRETTWAEVGLQPVDGLATTIDEAGSVRRATKVAVAEVRVDKVVTPRVAFAPYVDRRFPEQPDGTLGLDFFRGFDVAVDWAHKTFYLSPRQAIDTKQRIERWEVGALGQCKSLGCIAVRIVDPTVGKTLDPARPHPGVVLSITREEIAGGMDLEVVLEASNKPELPRIAVNLSPTTDRVLAHLNAEWVGAELVIVDASPYPRPCPAPGGCVDHLAR